MSRWVTAGEVRDWVMAYEGGKSLQVVADFAARDPKTVAKHLRFAGVEIRPVGPAPGGPTGGCDCWRCRRKRAEQ